MLCRDDRRVVSEVAASGRIPVSSLPEIIEIEVEIVVVSTSSRDRGRDSSIDRCRDSRDRGRDSSRDRSIDRFRSSGRRSVICYHCGAAGHVSPDCPDKGRQYQAASAEVGDRRDMAQRSVSFARGPEYSDDEQRDYYGRGRNRYRG